MGMRTWVADGVAVGVFEGTGLLAAPQAVTGVLRRWARGSTQGGACKRQARRKGIGDWVLPDVPTRASSRSTSAGLLKVPTWSE